MNTFSWMTLLNWAFSLSASGMDAVLGCA